MLEQRLRRWSSINAALGERLVCTGKEIGVTYVEAEIWEAHPAAHIGEQSIQECNQSQNGDQIGSYGRHHLHGIHGSVRGGLHHVTGWTACIANRRTQNEYSKLCVIFT